MGWQKDDRYHYTVRELKWIASHYEDYSPGHGFHLVEYKADFDRALNAIGKGYWDGRIAEEAWDEGLGGESFRQFRGFGRKQQVIIADICGISNWELRWMGFYDIGTLRWRAYGEMVFMLNGGE